MSAKRYLVSGRVQGVYFRQSTVNQAVGLGLRGYTRNLRDGRVEVVAAGAADAMKALEDWLYSGPPAAEVVSVESEDTELDSTTDFAIRRSE